MINVYRCVRYPDHTLLTFQGNDDDIAALENILHFRPEKSTLLRSYERGYYAYLRGPWREKSEREAMAYLSKNFSPPQVEFLMFESNTPLPDDRPSSEWPALLEWAIYNFFKDKGYSVGQGGLGFEVCRKASFEIAPGLRVYDGITYCIHVASDFVARLQADITYRFQINGESKTVNLKTIQTRFAGQPDVMKLLNEHVTRDMDAIFDIATKFTQSIPPLSIADNCRFIPQPVTVQSLGLETWLWEHDAPIDFEVGGSNKISLPTLMPQYGFNAYTEPPDSVVTVVVHPSEDVSAWCSFTDWDDIRKLVSKALSEILGGEAETLTSLLEYPVVDGKLNQVTNEAEMILQRFVHKIPLFIVITPPKGSRRASDSALRAASSFTHKLFKGLRRLRRGGYVVTLNWDKLTSDRERPYIVELAVIKGLVVLGAIPWRISGIAHSKDETDDELCFIGVDVNIYKHVPVVGGVALNAQGELLGYHLVRLESPKGDEISAAEFSLLMRRLIKHYNQATGRQPQHIIIHRDGISGSEVEGALEVAEQFGLDCDFIEVRKQGAPRMRQVGNIAGTPSKDIAAGSDTNGVAYLVNTLSIPNKLSNNLYVFPAPNSIAIHQVTGRTKVKILAAQVHALSRAYYGSYRRTVNLPATIMYADALVNNASLKKNQRDFGKRVSSKAVAYWL